LAVPSAQCYEEQNVIKSEPSVADDVLLRFLDAGLLSVGGDDAKFEKLQQTAKDLAAELSKSPTLATAFALIAFDANAPVDDPVVIQALAALKVRWATFMNTFSATPISVVRALLLEALAIAAASDERIGVAFVTSARNVLPFTEVGGEQSIWANVVADIERRVDARAESEWATPDNIIVPPLKAEAPEIGGVSLKVLTVQRPWLAGKVRAAGGPQSQGPEGTIDTDGNPHWPHGNPAHWNHEFGTRLSEAIADAIDAVVKKIEVIQPDLSAPFQIFADQIGSFVEGSLNAVNGATAGLQRRTNLLWWKEALYSPSARLRYRELSPTTAAALMGFDLHRQVPTFSPASVAAFLAEAVEALPGLDAEKLHTFRELVVDARSALAVAALRDTAARLIAKPEGRGPVLALVAHTEVTSVLADEDFLRLTGIPADAELTLPNWAAWVYREMQAARAVTDASTPKKRGKKA
jgi:hypothetical protein